MKIVRLFLAAIICLIAGPILAAEYKGTIKSVNGDIATVTMEGDVMPPNGAKAEIFFKLAGSNEEISVATGTAGSIDHGAMQLKIDHATGTVETGHLVRFSTSAAATTTTATAKPAASQPNKPIAFKRAIVGEWKQIFDQGMIIFEINGRVRATQKAGNFTARYRVDTTKSPPHIDLFEFQDSNSGEQDGVVPGIFQVEGNRLKFEFDYKGERPTSFDEGCSTATRVGQVQGDSIVGEWRQELGITHTFTFTAEGMVRNYYEITAQEPNINEYRYELDDSTSPTRINFYFEGVNDPGFRGIVEFDSNDRMRIDGNWTKKEEERPKTFGKDTYELARTR